MNDFDYKWYAHGYLIYADWDRKDSIDECAERMYGFFTDFARMFPEWVPFWAGCWHNTFYEVPSTRILRDIICKCRNPKYVDSVGSTVVCCNTGTGNINQYNYNRYIEIAITAAAYDGYTNSIEIHFPPANEDMKCLSNVNTYKNLFDIVLNHWSPEFGCVDNLHWKLTHKTIEHVGWLNYGSNKFGELPVLPNWASVIPVGNIGKYVLATDELTDEAKLIRRVEDLNKILVPYYP
ncbi:MAG: hypothetical protein Q4G68_03440 [Planctomycetia bacterium]|nr:hypothetical protein [Planctomycetia bacterium]